MPTIELERTLVKSPPELWEELTSDASLSRWFGEVEVEGTDPPRRLQWRRAGASGTIELEPSNWGTKVRALVTIDEAPVWAGLLGQQEGDDFEQRLRKLLEDLGSSSLKSG